MPLPRVIASLAVAVAAVTTAVVWPLVGFASSRHAASPAASSSFTDPTGDSGGGPDVTTVQVSDDESGKITFTATIPNRQTLSDQDGVAAFFDTDSNSNTGGNGGFEYEVGWISGEQVLLHWDGAQFSVVSPAPASFSASYKDGVATFGIDKADFGGSTAFDFVVTTTGDTGDSTADRAPDGSAVWAYPSGGTSTPPPSPPPPPGSPPPPAGVTLTASKFTVGKPHSGHRFTVSMVVRVKETNVAVKTAVSCAASVAGKPIRATRKGSVLSGHASCTWQLPAGSKGKLLRGSITASYLGAKIRKSFSRTVLP